MPISILRQEWQIIAIFFLLALRLLSVHGHEDLVQLVVPARPSCSEKSASIDFVLRRCVLIDHLQKRIPDFAPCPPGTTLEGRNCVGTVETDFELGCPLKFSLNDNGMCVRGETYSPPKVVCPEGYKPIVRRQYMSDYDSHSAHLFVFLVLLFPAISAPMLAAHGHAFRILKSTRFTSRLQILRLKFIALMDTRYCVREKGKMTMMRRKPGD